MNCHRRVLTILLPWVLASSCLPGVSENDAGLDASAADSGIIDAGNDAGVVDGGITDGGNTDAGFIDAGESDAGIFDAGLPDAGMTDAGPIDAGVTDAGFLCAQVPQGYPSNDAWARERTTVDQPDDAPGEYQVHIIYVEPSDVTAPIPLDINGTLRRSVNAFNAWFAAKTGGPRFRIDTCGGDIDVTYVKLATTEAAMATGAGTSLGPAFIRERLEERLAAQFADPKKLYLVYWDGLTYGRCGGAPYPPLLPGHFTSINVGGIFQATFLTSAASAGDTVLNVYSTFEMGLPTPPFTAQLGAETLQVTASTDTTLTLAAPLSSNHAAQKSVRADTPIPDCRANPFSSDGTQLNYWEMASAHECLHPLGIVSSAAPNFAQAPTAPGHLNSNTAAGRFDLMYQGNQAWGCATTAASPGTSPCELDPAHVEYWSVPVSSNATDLAKSVFLTPTPVNAQLPANW